LSHSTHMKDENAKALYPKWFTWYNNLWSNFIHFRWAITSRHGLWSSLLTSLAIPISFSKSTI